MDTKHPRVSVIIPVYNGSQYLAEAVESVLAQTYTDYEIIVADDGSTTDSPRGALEKFGDKVTLLEFPHRGICATRNEAIQKSQGELIALLDSDDLWLPNKLELQVAYLDEHPEYALVYSYSTNFTNESKDEVALVKKVDFEGWTFVDLFTKNSFGNSTIVMRRAAFDEVGGYDENLKAMEDYDLNLRLSRKFQIGRVPESLIRRRIHPGSFYTSGYDNQYVYQLPVYDKYMSDPEVEKLVGTSKLDYMTSFIAKFIFKNLYDERPEFIDQKLKDLEGYSPEKAQQARALVEAGDVSLESWQPLVDHFETWYQDVKHKAELFKARHKDNFDVGARRLG
jgi:glycosyltransferase involved in cell wall biosynthesis